MAINIIDKTSTHNTTASKNRSILYLVIHYTAGTTSKSGSAANTAAYFAGTTVQASADFIVDDANIVQYNPDPANRYCWHCGGNKYTTTKGGSLHGVAKNANSIGIEICSTNSTGTVKNANDASWSYTDAAVAKAVELTKYLMEKYGIDADHVIRHYDVTGKLCPGIIGWNADSGDESKWQAFKAQLGASSGSSSASSGSSSTSSAGEISVSDLPAVPFTVKVIVDDLNYRSKGSMSGTVKGQTGKGTFTITEVNSSGWGKLKSGAGWIYLLNTSYCTIGETVTDSGSSSDSSGSSDSFLVKVSISNLNIRKGPGTDYDKTGKFTGKGTFTIVETSEGTGSTAGWGLLKSYQKNRNGWISLDHATKV